MELGESALDRSLSLKRANTLSRTTDNMLDVRVMGELREKINEWLQSYLRAV